MTDELPFRLALAALFLLLVPVGVYHRVRSQATGERLDRRQEGLFVLSRSSPATAARHSPSPGAKDSSTVTRAQQSRPADADGGAFDAVTCGDGA